MSLEIPSADKAATPEAQIADAHPRERALDAFGDESFIGCVTIAKPNPAADRLAAGREQAGLVAKRGFAAAIEF